MRLIDADALKKSVLDLHDCYNGFSDTYDKACIIGVIDEEPTIEPEQRWIPCSERYPEDGQYVLVQFINGQMATIFFSGIGEKGHLAAWMPLPRPWKGEQP